MKQSEVIEMAKQAGIEEAYSLKHNQYLVQFKDGSLVAFAKLVAEKEREACAKACEHQPHWTACCAAIRARGNT